MSRSIYARRRQIAAGFLLLLGPLAAFILWWRAPGAVNPAAAGLNVLLITIDTLRADAVGAYGQPGGLTPWIDRLAAVGARFTTAHAHTVMTLPSHANILSGRLPTDHGVRDNAGFRFPAGMDTLATVLETHGYRTAAFVSAFPLESRFGLARGFDVYDDRFADAARPAFVIQERRGVETVGRAVRWLAAQGDNPWLCWVHVYEPHFPYVAPEPFASRFPNEPYLAEVAAADATLAPLLEPVLAAGDRGRTVVVLTSDHGEALGDHGEATHGVFAYEATLRVPLVIFHPRVHRPTVVDAPARHVDLLPTILEAIALPMPAGLPGRSLLSAMSGRREGSADGRPVTYFEALSASLNRGWAPLDGVIQDATKYIDLPIPELYDLANDPREAHNLATAQPARVEALRALTLQLRGTRIAGMRQAESSETRERLKSLGYISASGNNRTSRYTEADDPKRLIELDALLQDVLGLYLEGHLQAASARCRELIARRPDMPLSFLFLGHIERESGNLEAAVGALRKAVALAPGNAEAVALLGAYLTQAGRAAEASELLDRYGRQHEADVEVQTSHALALARLGRTSDALARLARARELDPSNAMLLVHTGTVLLMSGDGGGARRQFEAALAMNPDVARAHSSLGALDVEDRHFADAVAHWRLATAVDPREFATILGLGLSLGSAGRTAEARAALEFFIANAPSSHYARDIEHARALVATLPPPR